MSRIGDFVTRCLTKDLSEITGDPRDRGIRIPLGGHDARQTGARMQDIARGTTFPPTAGSGDRLNLTHEELGVVIRATLTPVETPIQAVRGRFEKFRDNRLRARQERAECWGSEGSRGSYP